ncbi:MAG TPA: SMP-30/gluconolactonase/LRE family protein [Leptospiraceae bacterium]|nr:SMP-30/gluconolactonase/LRE family protein [Leptospiraceae bacterium]HMW04237.1 SMP-30/gluconolactonase/LRE family protein [Leptospiraceae bacterium]HMX34299.1 SMP-30/gluconolactonase/LRE family protein [Leptospiraceae bacterium]HMY31283.1 SMP-30/gluconolactonase/LRE family protein [Leptospiraceae bacterium]HMZ63396.1 SMP-30/gluconolactonase/LRE family protein [Leptospiraceae bacterium]
MKKFKIFLFFLILLVSYFTFKSTPIDPVAFTPPEPREMNGPLSKNEILQKAELLGLRKIHGPEGLAIDRNGIIYGGTAEGNITRIYPDGKVEPFINTGGRPLGIEFDANGNLIVCDAWKGLLSVSKEGKVTTLSDSADNVPFRFTDDLDIASDGMIYFTDASSKFHQPEYLYDLLEGKPHGRFLKYNPYTKETTVLLKNLYFANGVALSKNEDFVLINETYRYRITRFYLKGEKKGTSDIFLENTPGFPDNITSNRKGSFYLALFTVRNPMMDRIHPHPFFTKLMSKLPKFFWPKPKPYGLVIRLDESGNILESYQDPSGKHLKEITSALEYNGFLYLGSLHNDRIGKLELSK